MIVTFNDKGMLVNNSKGETVIRGHLDLGNNLYIVPADNTIQYETPQNEILLKYCNTEPLLPTASSMLQTSSSTYMQQQDSQ